MRPRASFGRPATWASALCLTIGACSLFRPDRDGLSGGSDRPGVGGSVPDAGHTDAGGFGAAGGSESAGAGGSGAQESETGGGGTASALDASAASDADASGGSDSGDDSWPAPIPRAGLVLWLRGDDDAIESRVTRWIDRSSLGNDATQSIVDAVPVRAENMSGGLPAVEFDGQNDHLLIKPLAVDWSAGVTFFSVAALDTGPGGCGSVVSLRGSDSDDRVEFVWDQEVFGWSTTFGDVTAGRTNDGRAQVMGVLHAPPGFVLLSVNTSIATSESLALPRARPLDHNRIGNRLNCGSHDGLIAEIILYARPLESFEYTLVETYLMTKWRILPD